MPHDFSFTSVDGFELIFTQRLRDNDVHIIEVLEMLLAKWFSIVVNLIINYL